MSLRWSRGLPHTHAMVLRCFFMRSSYTSAVLWGQTRRISEAGIAESRGSMGGIRAAATGRYANVGGGHAAKCAGPRGGGVVIRPCCCRG